MNDFLSGLFLQSIRYLSIFLLSSSISISHIQKEMNAYLEYNPDVFRGKTVLLPCDEPEWSNITKFFAQNIEAFGLKKLISTCMRNLVLTVDGKPQKSYTRILFSKKTRL